MSLSLLCCLAQAPTPTPAPTDSPNSLMFWTTNALWLTIGLIFLSSVIAILFKGIIVDRCFKAGKKKEVLLVLSGKGYAGTLRPLQGGLSLTRTDGDAILIFQPEYGAISAMLWISDHKEARRLTHYQRVGRATKNFFNRFRDAIVQGFGTIMTQAKTMNPGTALLQTHGQKISSVGTDILSQAPAQEFEPMLESFLGRILRFEWEGKSLQGRLLEYSRDYLLFEEVEADIAFQLDLPLIGKFIEGPLGIHLCRNKTTLQARNQGTKELTLSHAGAAKILKPFEAFSNPSEALVSFACQETAPLLSLSLHGIFTLLLPRAKATPREALSPDQQLRFRTTSAEIEEEIEAQEAVNAAEQKEASLKDEKE